MSMTTLAPADTAAPPAPACASCATPLAGAFCHACGEKRIAAEDRAVRHVAREAAAEVFSVDSTLLRTVRTLVLRPGELTVAWAEGRRRAYLGPFKLYLVLFAAVLALSQLLDRSAGGASATQNLAERAILAMRDDLATALGVPAAAAMRLLADRVTSNMSLLSALIPLLFGGVVALVFVRRRRYFAEHLVFATHLAILNFLLALVLLPLVALGPPAGMEAALSGVAGLAVWGWLAAAVRRVYGGSWAGAAVRAVVLTVGFSLAQSATAILALALTAAQIRML